MSRSHSVYEVEGEELTVYKAHESTKAVAATKIVWSERHVSYLDTKGQMFSSRIGSGSWFVGRRWGLGDIGLIEDAVALGVLSGKVNVEALRKLKEEVAARKSRGWAAYRITDEFKALGIKPTTEQARAIKKANKEAKGLI